MHTQDLADKLFFILGCGRSGTTLLKSMLDCNSGIFMPPETFFYSSVVPRFSGGDQAALEDKVAFLTKKWWIRDAGVTFEALMDDLAANPSTEFSDWDLVFLRLMALLVADRSPVAIGEKTPAHINHAPKLLAAFPKCKLIQIIRDPRAVLASYRSVKVGTNQAAAVIKEWGGAVETLKKIEGTGRVLAIRYEVLVQAPRQVLELVCSHLGIPLEESMLEFHKRKNKGFALEQSHHANTLTPVFASSIDAWRKKLPAMQVALVEHYLGSEMERFGYTLSPGLPKVRPMNLYASWAADYLHRSTVRRTRQLLKRLRAQQRLHGSSKSPT